MIWGLEGTDLLKYQESTSAFEVLTALKEKYVDERPAVTHTKMQEFITYKKKADDTVSDTWGKISKLYSEIVHLSPQFKEAWKPDQVLRNLLSSLPPEYETIVNTLMTRESLKEKDVLNALKEKEIKLKPDQDTIESGMYTGTRGRYRPPQKRSNWYERDRRSQLPLPRRQDKKSQDKSLYNKSRRGKTGYFICKDEKHQVRDCPNYNIFNKVVGPIMRTALRQFRRNKGVKGRLYLTDEKDGSQEESLLSEDDESDMDEVAALTQKAASKLLPTT